MRDGVPAGFVGRARHPDTDLVADRRRHRPPGANTAPGGLFMARPGVRRRMYPGFVDRCSRTACAAMVSTREHRVRVGSRGVREPPSRGRMYRFANTPPGKITRGSRTRLQEDPSRVRRTRPGKNRQGVRERQPRRHGYGFANIRSRHPPSYPGGCSPRPRSPGSTNTSRKGTDADIGVRGSRPALPPRTGLRVRVTAGAAPPNGLRLGTPAAGTR
ncbi:hypothetical protein FHX42_005253 [Saccharopolyspora lacisalsi]|uniref:Uncharacterized protein n=1 Tax=Halosaccharopolyspora lacisalsi TaxID=1000566 RepID=A0A839E5E6_9PSEU|nr:hypothetical protein [Halosaccharopolyspora lacisalsi]